MRFYKSLAFKTIAITAVFVMSFSTVTYAMTFKDVPSSHWAYKAVDAVSNKGIMVGDLSANFKPDDLIDKFETSKILAKMAGYKYTDASADEQQFYNRCYDNHIGYINQYVSKFKKWNSNYNKEIAFLLEKKIITNDDLNQFVIIVNDNEERLRALSREEACMFLIKVMGKTNEANANTPSNLFKDDASITKAYRPYVYYSRSIGIVGGDTSNNFNPKNAATRAAMAVMINSALNIMNPTPSTPNPAPVPSVPVPNPSTNPSNNNSQNSATAITTVQGTIAKLYAAAKAIQVSSSDANYDKKIYMVGSKTTVTIDGSPKSFTDLKEGMNFVGVFSGSELISVSATSGTTTPTTPTQPTPPLTSAQTFTIEGTVSATKSDDNGSYIDIETRTINPRGEISSIITTYTLDKNAVIKRGSSAAAFTTIVVGDIATLKVSGNTIYEIELIEKDVNISGTLTGKRIDEKTGTPILTVTDSTGKKRDFRIVVSSDVSRKTYGKTTWDELRVGDKVDVKAEYDVIKVIYGIGTLSTVDVWVKDIYISATFSRITAVDADNKEKVYPLINGSVDPYSIRVGSKVRLNLDSQEVESFSVLSDNKANTATGVITSITRSTITVKDTSLAYPPAKDIKYDSSTVVIDSTNGRTVSTSTLDTDMTIFVVFEDSSSNFAKTITILSH